MTSIDRQEFVKIYIAHEKESGGNCEDIKNWKATHLCMSGLSLSSRNELGIQLPEEIVLKIQGYIRKPIKVFDPNTQEWVDCSIKMLPKFCGIPEEDIEQFEIFVRNLYARQYVKVLEFYIDNPEKFLKWYVILFGCHNLTSRRMARTLDICIEIQIRYYESLRTHNSYEAKCLLRDYILQTLIESAYYHRDPLVKSLLEFCPYNIIPIPGGVEQLLVTYGYGHLPGYSSEIFDAIRNMFDHLGTPKQPEAVRDFLIMFEFIDGIEWHESREIDADSHKQHYDIIRGIFEMFCRNTYETYLSINPENHEFMCCKFDILPALYYLILEMYGIVYCESLFYDSADFLDTDGKMIMGIIEELYKLWQNGKYRTQNERVRQHDDGTWHWKLYEQDY